MELNIIFNFFYKYKYLHTQVCTNSGHQVALGNYILYGGAYLACNLVPKC
jgi:hypothetical protein